MSSINSRFHFFLRCTWNISQDRPYLGHKSNLGKLNKKEKKNEIISNIIPDHKAIRLETNYREKKNYEGHKHMKVKLYASK